MMWKKLSLSEEEDSEYSERTIEMIGGKTITAKFFTRRVLNMEAIALTFKHLWQTKKGFEVKDMGNHVVLFFFSDGSDVDRVLLGEPWSYNKYLVSLCKLEKIVAVRDLVLIERPFGYKSMTYQWVR